MPNVQQPLTDDSIQVRQLSHYQFSWIADYQRRRSIHHHWTRARKAAGVDQIRIHDLRHLAATLPP